MDIDAYLIASQVLLFLVFWALIKRLWVDPALRVIKERARRSEGAIAQAKAMQAEVEQLRQRQAAVLDQARAEAQSEMQAMVRAAESEQKRLIAEARAEARGTLGEIRGRLAEEVAAARRELHDAAGDMAQRITRKLVGRGV